VAKKERKSRIALQTDFRLENDTEKENLCMRKSLSIIRAVGGKWRMGKTDSISFISLKRQTFDPLEKFPCQMFVFYGLCQI